MKKWDTRPISEIDYGFPVIFRYEGHENGNKQGWYFGLLIGIEQTDELTTAEFMNPIFCMKNIDDVLTQLNDKKPDLNIKLVGEGSKIKHVSYPIKTLNNLEMISFKE